MVAFVSDQRHQNELKLCLTLLYLSLSTELYVYLPYSAHTKASSFDRSAALTSSVVPSLAKASITDWSFFRVFSGLTFLFPAKQLVVSEPVKALRPRIASLKLEDIDNAKLDISIWLRLFLVPVSKIRILLILSANDRRRRKSSVSGDFIVFPLQM